MRLAAFNGFPFHYEMFAHVLDYCKNQKKQAQDIDIYTNTVNDYGWLALYEETYSVNTWLPISRFDPSQYDCVILLTDDDRAYAPFWNATTHVVVIEHAAFRHLPLPAQVFLQTRHMQIRTPPSNPDTWVIPVWDNPPYEKYPALTVVCVGGGCNMGVHAIRALFSNVDDIRLIFITHNLGVGNIDTHGFPNVTFYHKLDAEMMLEYVGKSTYLLVAPYLTSNYNYKDQAMSGSIPLAYSVGTPVLMLQSWADLYNLPGIVCIPDTSPIELNYPTTEQLDMFYTERASLLARRDAVLTKALDSSSCI